MKEIETIEERLQRYFIAVHGLTPEEGKHEAEEIINIVYKYFEEVERGNSRIDKDKMIFEFQGTLKELVKALKDFRDDYRTAHGMNYDGGGGMFGGLFGRKK